MRVLYVLRYYPTLTETFVYREITALQARGVEVTVAALGRRDDGALQDEAPAVPVWRPPRGREGWRLLGPALRAVRDPHPPALRPKDRWRARWLGERARAGGFDRIHAHFAGEAAAWARLAAQVAGVPFSLTAHAVDLFDPGPGLAGRLGAADPVITVARYHRAWIAERYGVRARVVRCGVQPDRYPAARPGGAGPLRVVCVARHVPKKGLEDLVAAVEAVPGVCLRLVSDAPAAWASERVEVGPLRPSQVPGALARAHAFALPCRVTAGGDRDGVPVALIEAMAAGLPVITTPTAGIPELVDEAVGWWARPGDPATLGQVLAQVAAAPSERARRGRAARERVRRAWTVDRQAEALLAAWGAA